MKNCFDINRYDHQPMRLGAKVTTPPKPTKADTEQTEAATEWPIVLNTGETITVPINKNGTTPTIVIIGGGGGGGGGSGRGKGMGRSGGFGECITHTKKRKSEFKGD
jgi:hypothetical protein